MKNYFKLITLTLCIGIFSCSKSDDSGGNGNGGGGDLDVQATYRITFTTNFTSTTHPTDYPTNAKFGTVFLAAHSPGSSVFNLGGLASDGFKKYAEEGSLTDLINEHSGGGDTNNMTIVTGSSNVDPSTTVTFEINVIPSKTRISFVSKISPSPDWFVGVDSFDIVMNGNELLESASVRLYPLDAGTDSGVSYESPDSPEPGPMFQIEGAPFSSGDIQSTQVATFTIERIDQ